MAKVSAPARGVRACTERGSLADAWSMAAS
jgi:hypothetical protein